MGRTGCFDGSGSSCDRSAPCALDLPDAAFLSAASRTACNTISVVLVLAVVPWIGSFAPLEQDLTADMEQHTAAKLSR